MLKFVTSNAKKFVDARCSFEQAGIDIERVCMNLPEIQASSAREVCWAKAEHACTSLEGEFFVEDSSFHIPALNGFPGPYARYVLETIGAQGILAIMKGVIVRECFFLSAVVYRDICGHLHEFMFRRDGLRVMSSQELFVTGWSELWSILGVSALDRHFCTLDQPDRDELEAAWRSENSFTKLVNFVKVSRQSRNGVYGPGI